MRMPRLAEPTWWPARWRVPDKLLAKVLGIDRP
jgi:hypothetical protein